MSALLGSVEGPFLRFLMGLPESVVQRMAGRPVVREGNTLAPETQLMLRLQQVMREPDVASLPIEQGRIALDRQCDLIGGDVPITSVRDIEVNGRSARLYTPSAHVHSKSAPTLLFFHGGGMIYGGLDSHDAACRYLANHSGVQVLAFDYRLAPEHPYPAAVEDCADAYRWLAANASQLNADPERLAVGGDSAGGYLAATTAMIAAEEGIPLAFQLLIYPATDFVEKSASRKAFGEGFFLTSEFMDLAATSYFGSADRGEPLASVLRRTDFPADIAPALVVTAGFDPLRDEGEAYAKLLADRGVELEYVCYGDMIHGFFNMVSAGRCAPKYCREIAEKLGAALA